MTREGEEMCSDEKNLLASRRCHSATVARWLAYVEWNGFYDAAQAGSREALGQCQPARPCLVPQISPSPSQGAAAPLRGRHTAARRPPRPPNSAPLKQTNTCGLVPRLLQIQSSHGAPTPTRGRA